MEFGKLWVGEQERIHLHRDPTVAEAPVPQTLLDLTP